MPPRTRTRVPPPEVLIDVPPQGTRRGRRPSPPKPDRHRPTRAASAAAPQRAREDSEGREEGFDNHESIAGQAEEQQEEEEDSDAQVADELLSPIKPKGKGKGKGKGKARKETAVEETPFPAQQENEAEDSLDPPKRSVRPSQTYRKRASPRKAKTAARQPSLVPESASDGDYALQRVRQPVASTSNAPAQSAASPSPSRAHASPASPREQFAPALPRTSQIQPQSQRRPAASAPRRRRPSRYEPHSPRKRSFRARSISSEDDTDNDPDRPDNPDRPASFMCWDPEKGAFVPDLVWLHDKWTRPDQRDQLVRAIEENGGTVVDKMKRARIAVLPKWYQEGYKELWTETVRHGAQPVLDVWIHDALKYSSPSSPSYRPNPYSLAYQSRRPPDQTKTRKTRIANLSLQEEALLEKLRNKTVLKVICQRMETEFFHIFHHNAEDYAKILPALLERQEDSAPSATRHKPSTSRQRSRHRLEQDLDEVDGEDGADELQPEIEKSPTHPPPVASHARSDLQRALETLSAQFSRPIVHVRALYFYASFDLDLVESVLSALRKSHALLHPAFPAEPNVIDAKATFRYALNHLWSFEQDEALLQEGAHARIVKENEWPAEAVQRRARLLTLQGMEWSAEKGEDGREWRRGLWYPVLEE
ncbi:hypothetical protein JCM1841_000731 [Sporobolomyces salmonicolor]